MAVAFVIQFVEQHCCSEHGMYLREAVESLGVHAVEINRYHRHRAFLHQLSDSHSPIQVYRSLAVAIISRHLACGEDAESVALRDMVHRRLYTA